MNAKIAVLDFGGQYAHLIASRIRRLGAYSELVYPGDITVAQLREYSGVIYSGGPASVYEKDAPVAPLEFLDIGKPILGICYGHQLIMQQLGGDVKSTSAQEFGPAKLKIESKKALFEKEESGFTVWMSHGDEVSSLPEGFLKLASTDDCKFAAVMNEEKRIFGVQFHPEVNNSERGEYYLRNFLSLCGVLGTWNLHQFIAESKTHIASQVGNKKVFFLVSGGVDSTVAYSLTVNAIGQENVKGVLVDTGLLRENEAAEVKQALANVGIDIHVEDASELFYNRLAGVSDPEAKRKIIGDSFLDVQEQVSERLKLDTNQWFLGQGTIYPDTIESGGTKSSHKIKTHHNRVDRIQKMISEGRILEPIHDLYKDEVREVGKLLGLPAHLLERHPFPGPGLGVRCLCSPLEQQIHPTPWSTLPIEGAQTFVLPIRSVGVQGDMRSYAHPLAVETFGSMNWEDLLEFARLAPNRDRSINRVVLFVAGKGKLSSMSLKENRFITPDRIFVLQTADGIVRKICDQFDLTKEIWQFPVALLPFGQEGESIVLRPIVSQDAMTASAYKMKEEILQSIATRLITLKGVDAIFFDLTTKPPGTIEWE